MLLYLQGCDILKINCFSINFWFEPFNNHNNILESIQNVFKSEYNEYMAHDALKRRFDIIKVNELYWIMCICVKDNWKLITTKIMKIAAEMNIIGSEYILKFLWDR